MYRDSDLQNIFQVPITYCQLDVDVKQMAKECVNYYNEYEKEELIKSNVGGFHSGSLNLFHKKSKVFKSFFKQLDVEVKRYQAHVKCPKIKGLDSSWFMINNYKDYNAVHTHPQSVISGVFYVKVPEKSGELEFHHPITDYLDMYWPQKNITEYNSWNSPVWRIPVKEGKLILFPSWLKHGVQPNLNKTESRISVSFNYN